MPSVFKKAKSKFKQAYATYVPTPSLPGTDFRAPVDYPPSAAASHAADEFNVQRPAVNSKADARCSYQTTSTTKSAQSGWSPQCGAPPGIPLPALPGEDDITRFDFKSY